MREVIYLDFVKPNFLSKRFMEEKEKEIREISKEISLAKLKKYMEKSYLSYGNKEKQMDWNTARKITDTAFALLKSLSNITYFLVSGENIRGKVKYVCNNEGCVLTEQRIIADASVDDWGVTYRVEFPDRTFEIFFANSGDICDNHSKLDNYPRDTYLYCDFLEKRKDESWKYNFSFAIDIEKGTFLELFELNYWNQIDYTYVFQEIDKFEKELSGRKVLEVYSDDE